MKFRVNRKKFGLTWSCPTGSDDNPIPNTEAVVQHLEAVNGKCMYSVAEEHHKDGKRHYHAWCKYDSKLDSTNARIFDLEGVHPNIINPGGGWLHYVQKDEDGKTLVSNLKKDVFTEASRKRTWEEASSLLWEAEPKWMLQHAKVAKMNFEQRDQGREKGIQYYGPWPKIEWEPERTLVLRGPAGCGKTQWAKWFARHSYPGEWLYVKGPIDKAKTHYHGQKCIIFDDLSPFEKWGVNDWCSLFDCENGGSVNLRNAPLDLEPGVRILIDNGDIVWPEDNKLKRRIHIYNVEGTLCSEDLDQRELEAQWARDLQDWADQELLRSKRGEAAPDRES